MADYWPYIVPGLVSGAIYALLAVGVVLTYQTTGVFNFAFGAQAYVSAIIYYDLRVDAGWGAIPAVIMAAFVAAPFLGYVLDRLVFSSLRRAPMLTKIAVSIGLLVAIPAIVSILTGGSKDRLSPPPIALDPREYYQWGSLNVDSDQIAIIIVATVMLLLLGGIMKFSDLGLRMRAVVESGRLSELDGVSAGWISTVAWMISSTLAGLAGVMLAPLFPDLTPFNFTLLLMAAIAAAVFGRFSSLGLTVVGALITGVGAELIKKPLDLSSNLAAGLQPSFPFILLFVLLLVMPGLARKTHTIDPMSGVDPPPSSALGGVGKLPGTKLQQLIAGAVVIGGAVLWANNYWSAVFAEAAIMGVVFLSLGLLTGMSGHISLCQAAFVGNGAWVTAQLALERDWNVFLGCLVGGLLAGFLGFMLSLPALRLGALPLALATFGFQILCEKLIFNQSWSFQSTAGINPPRPELFGIDFTSNKSFLLMSLVFLLLGVLLIRAIANGSTGRYVVALRGSETAAASVGINGTPLKIAMFTLSATIAGVAGGLLGSLNTVVSPSAFTSGTSMYWLVIVLVIGVYTVRGPVVAGVVFVLVPEVVSHLPAELGLLQFALFGTGVVFVARHPEGVLEFLLTSGARRRARDDQVQRSERDVKADEEARALLAGELDEEEFEPQPDPLGVLPVGMEDRTARAARRRALRFEAAKLRLQIPRYPLTFISVLIAATAIDAGSRSLFGVVLDDIRREFDASDAQLGFLSGAYAVVAALSVVPFGWMTDRFRRVRLVALGFIPWSLGMMAQGMATGLGMLFVARLALGSIEATNGPATPSLMGDYYPVRRRNGVFGRFAVGVTAGNAVATLLGGAIASSMGWRAAFIIWGIAGIFIGFLVLRTLKEPARGLQDALFRVESEIASLDQMDALESQALEHPADATEILAKHPVTVAKTLPPGPNGDRAATAHDYRSLGFMPAIKELWHIKTLRWFILSQAVSVLFLSLLGIWAITFFRRYHGLSAAGAAGVVSLLSISLMFGAAQGGRVGDRLVNRGTPQARVKLIAIAQVAFFFFQIIAWGTPQLAVAVPFFLISGYVIGFMGSAEGAGLTAVVLIDTIVPHLRGRAVAVRSVLMVGSTAIAPIILGVLSDEYGLRQALMMMAPVMVIAAICTLMGGRHWTRDFTHAQQEAVRQASLEHENLDFEAMLEEDFLVVGAGDIASTEDALVDRATRN